MSNIQVRLFPPQMECLQLSHQNKDGVQHAYLFKTRSTTANGRRCTNTACGVCVVQLDKLQRLAGQLHHHVHCRVHRQRVATGDMHAGQQEPGRVLPDTGVQTPDLRAYNAAHDRPARGVGEHSAGPCRPGHDHAQVLCHDVRGDGRRGH